ncbi:hypothetical protein RFI_18521, partial [Reticulomyxa filosa]
NIIDYTISLLKKNLNGDSDFAALESQLSVIAQIATSNYVATTTSDYIPAIEAMKSVFSLLTQLGDTNANDRLDCDNLSKVVFSYVNQSRLLNNVGSAAVASVNDMYQVLMNTNLFTLQKSPAGTQCSDDLDLFQTKAKQIVRDNEQGCGDSSVKFRISNEWLAKSHTPLITCAVIKLN